MESCWADDDELRPDVKEVSATIQKFHQASIFAYQL